MNLSCDVLSRAELQSASERTRRDAGTVAKLYPHLCDAQVKSALDKTPKTVYLEVMRVSSPKSLHLLRARKQQLERFFHIVSSGGTGGLPRQLGPPRHFCEIAAQSLLRALIRVYAGSWSLRSKPSSGKPVARGRWPPGDSKPNGNTHSALGLRIEQQAGAPT